jgi:hypothetical protein
MADDDRTTEATADEAMTTDESTDDTEGQSLAAFLALQALTTAPPAAVPADEDLPKLTKRFPRMRGEGAIVQPATAEAESSPAVLKPRPSGSPS